MVHELIEMLEKFAAQAKRIADRDSSTQDHNECSCRLIEEIKEELDCLSQRQN